MDHDEEELIVGVAAWGALMNRRGHASIFAQDRTCRELVDRSTATEFARSLMSECSFLLTDIRNRNPPEPDCFAQSPIGRITIELKELVNGQAIAQVARDRNKDANTSEQQTYASHWSAERLETALNQLIDDNAENPYPNDVDVLLIYSDEWIEPATVDLLLAESRIPARTRFHNVFLLLSCMPSWPHWPLFRIYGDLGTATQ